MNRSNELVISYLDLRRLVGTLGILFPAIVAVSGFVQCQCLAFQLSISHYYDLDGVTRDLFVGILMTMATFLWTYRGYDNRDLIAARLASVCAVVVALSARSGTAVQWVLHYCAAGLMFAVFAYFSLFLFTRSASPPPPRSWSGTRSTSRAA